MLRSDIIKGESAHTFFSEGVKGLVGYVPVSEFLSICLPDMRIAVRIIRNVEVHLGLATSLKALFAPEIGRS